MLVSKDSFKMSKEILSKQLLLACAHCHMYEIVSDSVFVVVVLGLLLLLLLFLFVFF